MLNKPEEIEDFRNYQNSGGLSTPTNLTKGRAVISRSSALSESFKSFVDSGVNYQADGIQELPEAILTLSNEYSEAVVRVTPWCDYISLAATPIDLEQVAQGVDVMCKLDGVENDKPAPSILPITSAIEIDDLATKIENVSTNENDLRTLMGKINIALQPVEIPPIPPATEPVVTPPPPLDLELKKQALSMIQRISSMCGLINTASLIIANMNKEARDNRDKAIKAFNDAVIFTLANNQKEKAPVKDVILDIFPKQ